LDFKLHSVFAICYLLFAIMNEIKSTPSVLIVEDTLESLDILTEYLETAGLDVTVALSGEKALKVIKKVPDIILLDIKLPGMDGFETCRCLKQHEAISQVPIIFITALTEISHKIKGFKAGGVDYITKPFQYEEVLMRINTHLTLVRQQQVLQEQNEQLKREITRREQAENALKIIETKETKNLDFSKFLEQSQSMTHIVNDIRSLQNVENTSVLILGESGTGKELIARAIHFGSARAKGPFIPINCSAVPSELAESYFFGHQRGAFTGAFSDRPGYFELADGGTLFLDEIADMPALLQTKLLRALEEGIVTPIGSVRSKTVNVRIITATNADLLTRIKEGKFRLDLYFRLSVYPIKVPPLRERQEDIAQLANYFISQLADKMGFKKTTLNQSVITALENYHFPGNVRELKNIIEHALVRSHGGPIQPHHLNLIETKSAYSVQSTTQPVYQDKQTHYDTHNGINSSSILALQTETISPIKMNSFLTIDEQTILNYVQKYGHINNQQCRQLLNSNFDRSSYLFKKLCQKGLLIRRGKGRGSFYQLP
jgi:DNA-binding NtrC family response regulator